jgi:uncharacterized RDD family membrane protein YckC
MYCGECGKAFPISDLANFGGTYICANCKPAYLQRLREGEQPVGARALQRRYAGFWIRTLALVIDGVIIMAVTMPIAFLLAFSLGFTGGRMDPEALNAKMGLVVLMYLVLFVIAIFYQVWFTSRKGGTPGKLALGLRIIRMDGQNLSMAHAFGRYLAHIISALPLYIGYIIAAFDSEKRALHDHICKTHVVYR